MPTICVFYGITIRLYFEDHPPPHIMRSIYGDSEAQVAIDPPRIIEGKLPRRAKSLVFAWMARHKDELLHCWAQAQDGLNPGRVAPLE